MLSRAILTAYLIFVNYKDASFSRFVSRWLAVAKNAKQPDLIIAGAVAVFGLGAALFFETVPLPFGMMGEAAFFLGIGGVSILLKAAQNLILQPL